MYSEMKKIRANIRGRGRRSVSLVCVSSFSLGQFSGCNCGVIQYNKKLNNIKEDNKSWIIQFIKFIIVKIAADN